MRRWCTARRWLAPTQTAALWCYVWARKDEHLQQLAVDLKRRAEHMRDAHFRREAIRIATLYASVTVDGYKISALKALPPLTMPGDVPREQAQHNAQAAAPGRFREILREVMGPRCTPSERPGDPQKAGVARRRKVVNVPAIVAGEEGHDAAE